MIIKFEYKYFLMLCTVVLIRYFEKQFTVQHFKKKSVLDAFLRRFYKTPLVPVFKSLFQDTFI